MRSREFSAQSLLDDSKKKVFHLACVTFSDSKTNALNQLLI